MFFNVLNVDECVKSSLLTADEHCIMCMTALSEHTSAKLLAPQTSSSEAFNL